MAERERFPRYGHYSLWAQRINANRLPPYKEILPITMQLHVKSENLFTILLMLIEEIKLWTLPGVWNAQKHSRVSNINNF